MNKKPQRRTHRDDAQGLVLTSWAGLQEYLAASPGDILKIRHAPAEKKRIENLLKRYPVRCPVEETTEEASVAAFIQIKPMEEHEFLEAVEGSREQFVLACDHVTDTRNLGAMARSAAFFGIRYLLLPKDRQAPITSATLGAAQGAFAFVRPVLVTNLARTLKALQERGFWSFCADMAGTPVQKLTQTYEKKVLVMGAEDKGVSANIRSKCDVTVSIATEFPQLESLNVSVAAGILIHALHAPSAAFKKES